MSLNSYLSVPVSSVQLPKESTSETYAVDWEAGRIIGRCDGLRAVEQAIKKVLFTPRFRCLIYDNQYGSELRDQIIYNNASRPFTESNVPWMVEDALSTDSRVLAVDDFEFEFKDDGVYIRFEARTVFGSIEIEEVI